MKAGASTTGWHRLHT